MLYYSGFVLYDEDILKRKKAKEKPKKSQKRGIYAYTEDSLRGRC
jgi:hypothetical protein